MRFCATYLIIDEAFGEIVNASLFHARAPSGRLGDAKCGRDGDAAFGEDEKGMLMGDHLSITRRGALAAAGAVASMFAVGGAAYALEGEDRGLLRPPGAQDEAHFRATCLKCNRCETACPQRCLRTGVLEDGVLNWRTPIMDFHRGLCDFCGVCEDVCPAGSIVGAHDPSQIIGVAVVDRERCIAWIQGGCQVCAGACPYGAITMDDANRPIVDQAKCNGCGACENACPSNSYLTFAGGTDRGINVRAAGKEA